MNSMAGKRVKLYAAPMEGVTGYIYRNIIDECFGGADRYFTPFISTNTNKTFTEQERRDIDSGNNRPGDVIPQILSNNSCDCIKVIRALHDEYGYDEVNLNLGCPSPTVVTKHKGAGFLAFPDKLDSFLNDVFVAAGKDGVRVSVKTRTGVESHDEFIKILDIYNQYPLSELIVHPRVQKDLYKNSPDYDIFEYAYTNSKAPVCYNGDICSVDDYQRITSRFNGLNAVMCGRGMITNPAIFATINGGDKLSSRALRTFHNAVFKEYCAVMGERNSLFKMKELWYYMIRNFDGADRYYKSIRKAQRRCDYEAAVNELFANCAI